MQVNDRELIKMVVKSNSTRKKSDIMKMYDRLESHLRALDSL